MTGTDAAGGRLTRRRRVRGLTASVVLCLGGWLGCHAVERAGRRSEAGGMAGWASGPIRWLMLPEEEREARRLRTNREAVTFIEAFWQRRDPDPNVPGNPAAQVFYERVEAADNLYGEGGVRGSLTDRGRALVLLGPPPLLSYGQRATPAWDPGPLGGRPAVQTRRLAVETWTYTAQDLSPALLGRLEELGRPPEVVLVFVVEPDRTHLTDGGKLLDLAVRAALPEREEAGQNDQPATSLTPEKSPPVSARVPSRARQEGERRRRIMVCILREWTGRGAEESAALGRFASGVPR